ncbi:MAG TPA: phosphatase PAP2 family protein [Croceibacterium sp.]|nr:phosphatase PAP2 family protein [Croceibacterium sp.]
MRPRWLPWQRIEIRLLAYLLAGAVALFALAKGASEIVEGDTLAFDRAVLLALRRSEDLASPIGPPWLQEAMVQITALGSIPVLSLIALLAVGYIAVARKPALALFTAAAVTGGALLAGALKLVYSRARPEIVPHLVGTGSSSFPSGHAADSAIVYLTLAALVARTVTSRAQSRYLIVAAFALTLLIGLSRVYLGVHYPTDVVAGWIVGALWAGAASLTVRRL